MDEEREHVGEKVNEWRSQIAMMDRREWRDAGRMPVNDMIIHKHERRKGSEKK